MKRTQKEAVNEFVALIGGKTWEKVSTPQKGDNRGTIAHGFVVDGRVRFYVSTGMKYFEENVCEWISIYKNFTAKKEYFSELVREQLKKDNEKAASEGLFDAKLIDLGILSQECIDQYDFFCPFALLEANGKRFKFRETSFKYAVMEDKLAEYFDFKCNRETFTAAGIEKPDFIFANVRHSTEDPCYKILARGIFD